jgi:hypothetical protein
MHATCTIHNFGGDAAELRPVVRESPEAIRQLEHELVPKTPRRVGARQSLAGRALGDRERMNRKEPIVSAFRSDHLFPELASVIQVVVAARDARYHDTD